MYNNDVNENNQNNLRIERNNNKLKNHQNNIKEKRVFAIKYKNPNKRHYEKKWYSLENKKPPDISKIYPPNKNQVYHNYKHQYNIQSDIKFNDRVNFLKSCNKHQNQQIDWKNQPPLKLKYLTPVEREYLYDILNQYKRILEEENLSEKSTFCAKHKVNALQVPICETIESRQFHATVRFEALNISEKIKSDSKSCLSLRSKISEKTNSKTKPIPQCLQFY